MTNKSVITFLYVNKYLSISVTLMIYMTIIGRLNPLTAGPDYNGVFFVFFFAHLYKFKIKRDINQQGLTIVNLHFVKY